MYGRKSRSSKSLKVILPSVPEVLQLVQVPPPPPVLEYTAHYKESSCIPVSFSLWHTMHLHDVKSVSGFCNSRPKTMCLEQRFYSQTNRASLGLESPTFTTDIWSDESPHTIRSHHQLRQFFINMWAGILGDYFISSLISPAWISGHDHFGFLRIRLNGPAVDVSFRARLHIWFQHDGAPPHCSSEVCQWLFENYPGHWIRRGREAPVSCPARSPDLNPIYLFLHASTVINWGQTVEKTLPWHCWLSSRYQETPTPQAYGVHVTVWKPPWGR
jgi:hypothetical protein